METIEQYGYMKTADEDNQSDPATELDTEEKGTQNAAQDTQPPKHLVDFTLLGFDGLAIEGLVCRIKMGELQRQYTTDADGRVPPTEVEPGQPMVVSVRRDNDTYKDIAELESEPGHVHYSFVSPALVVESKTEEHKGQPGTAQSNIPQPDAAATNNNAAAGAQATNDTAAPSSTTDATYKVQSGDTLGKIAASYKITLAELKSANGLTSDSIQIDQVLKIPATATGSAPAKKYPPPAVAPAAPASASNPTPTPPKSVTPGRDENGNPLAVVVTKVRDWWGNWRMPTFSLWSHSNFNGGAGAAGALSQTAPQSAKEEADKLAMVNRLLELAKTHTTWTITEASAAAALSMHKVDEVLTYERKGTTNKPTSTSAGLCARYVIIALTEAEITGRTATTGLLQFGSGSEGGPPLENAGWENVTDQLPDPRWAAPGDVIVYQWSETAMQSRRKMPRWDGSPQAPNMSLFNHGHIDIRSYDAYISDHIPTTNQPRWCDYTNIKIYRSKYHDPLPELRMRAFLRCIREFECQEEPDDSKRYNMLNTALPNQKERRFSGFATHPWAKVEKAQHTMEKVINGKKITTNVTASGAYQIQFATWQERVLGISGGDQYVALQQDLFLGNNEASFTADIQDRIAIAIIARAKENPLADIRKGLLEDASKKLRGIWSSLPGAKENEARKLADGRAMDNAYLTEIFNKYLNELIAKKAKK